MSKFVLTCTDAWTGTVADPICAGVLEQVDTDSFVFPSLTIQDGNLIAAAVLGLWALAWGSRFIYRQIMTSGSNFS